MATDRKFGFTTRQLHAGQQPDPTTGSRAVPIYQTTSYQFRDTEHAANLFALKEFGNIYTRIMNPTTDVLEQRIADLEGGVGALATCQRPRGAGPGHPDPCGAGDHIVTSSRLYGGTYNQFAYSFPRIGIDVTFVDPSDPSGFEKAIRPNTKILYGETLGNPDISVFPFEEIVALGKKHGIPVIDRQHLRHAVPLPAVRVGRQHRHPLDHQVHRRPRHLDRRRDRGRRQLRLDLRAASRTSPSPTRPITASSTRRWARRPSSSRPACRSCATSARASRRSTPGRPSRASRR